MLDVLIVDDERKIGKLLKHLIDWDSMNLHIIDIVQSGSSAMEIIEHEKPDILITDIRMPEVNGIQLLERIHKVSPLTKSIVISGYRKFEYAKKVMQFGVEDYLLKPIKKDELLTALNHIINERMITTEKNEYLSHLEQNREQLREEKRNRFFKDLISGNVQTEQYDINYLNGDLGFDFQEPRYQVFCIKIDRRDPGDMQMDLEEFMNKSVCAVTRRHLSDDLCGLVIVPCSDGLMGILNFKEENYKTIIRNLYHVIYDVKDISAYNTEIYVTVGLGKFPIESPVELPHAWRAAKKAVSQRIFSGVDQVITCSEGEVARCEDLFSVVFCEDVHRAVKEKDRKKLDLLFIRLKKEVRKRSISDGSEFLKTAEDWGNTLLCDTVKLHLRNETGKFSEKYRDDLAGCYTEEMVFSCMQEFYVGLLESLQSSSKQKDSQPICLAKTYIEQNYAEPVTLEEVSRHVGFSHTYLSSLFKKETGKNFSEYLSELRVNEAKRLLKDPDNTTLDVAEKVGYIDEKYFFRVFKKYTGLTPREYRQLYY